jgi:hypothetical protein
VTKAEVIRPFVEKTVQELLGVEQLQVNDDGSIPIRRGSTAVYVRLLDDEPPILRVFSPMLHGIPKTPPLLERLNDLNTAIRFARLFWVGDQVILATELVAETLDKEEVANAIDVVVGGADRLDDALRSEFGGEVLFAEPEPTGAAAATEGLPAPPPPDGTAGPPAAGPEASAEGPDEDAGYL